MDRRKVLCTLAAAAVANPIGALAESGAKARIGWLAIGPISTNLAAFRQALEQRGYLEGRNLILEERYPSAAASFPQLIADLARLEVDILVTTGGVASRAAKQARLKTPVVFLTTDPVGGGLVASLARPAGNLTGLAILTQDFNAKRVETIAAMVPGVRKFAALNDVSGALPESMSRAFWDESAAAAQRLGIQVAPKIEVRTIDEVDRAFAGAVEAGAGAMLTISSSYFNVHKQRLVAAAARTRLPTIYEHRDFVEAGGLVSYGPDLRDAFRVAATYVDKILKGAKPADLPVEQASKVELVINQNTAKALRLVIPQSLIVRADDVLR